MFRFLKPHSNSVSDAALLSRYQQANDADALGRLYARYADLVYGLCLKYLGDETEAEDAVMAIFELLMIKTREHEIGHFRNWLYTFARNHCLMQLRREKRLSQAKEAFELVYSNGSEHLLEKESQIEEEEEDLRTCIATLPEQQKACIEAFYLQEKTYKEIAQSRNEPLGRIRSYMQNGRRNLRICLESIAKAKNIE